MEKKWRQLWRKRLEIVREMGKRFETVRRRECALNREEMRKALRTQREMGSAVRQKKRCEENEESGLKPVNLRFSQT